LILSGLIAYQTYRENETKKDWIASDQVFDNHIHGPNDGKLSKSVETIEIKNSYEIDVTPGMINLENEGIVFFIYFIDRVTQKSVKYDESIEKYFSLKFHEIFSDENDQKQKITHDVQICN
jgi:hypothetical protein